MVHSFVYSYIPYVISAMSNITLIFHLKTSRKSSVAQNDTQKKRQNSVTITIIAMTVLFVVFTLPASLTAAYFVQLIGSDEGRILLVAGDTIGFSYHAFSVIILSATNKRFLRHLKRIFFLEADTSQSTMH